MPISVAFIIGTAWGILLTPGSLTRRISIFSQGGAHPDLIFMIWIFILAGAFAALASAIGAIEATVNLTLSVMPRGWIVPGVFIGACLVSMAIGTSVGTVTALVPLACSIASGAGIDTACLVSAVVGGSFFGDNLSFISDTTIAATRSQGCELNEKFKSNVMVVGPAALITVIIYFMTNQGMAEAAKPLSDTFEWWLTIPYILVIAGAMAGLNVIVVLLGGIVSCLIVGGLSHMGFVTMSAAMGTGIDSMGTLIIVTLLAGGMLALIENNGGISYLIRTLTARIKGRRGAYSVIGMLVGAVNICTANNTIAILTVGRLSRKVSERFGLKPRRVAGLLDTSSCLVQSLLPYGAQILLACGLSGLSPLSLYPFMYYPAALFVVQTLSIIFRD